MKPLLVRMGLISKRCSQLRSRCFYICLYTFNWTLLMYLFCLSHLFPLSLSVSHSQNRAVMGRIIRLSDTAIALESFRGSEETTNPLYKDYHGEKKHTYKSPNTLTENLQSLSINSLLVTPSAPIDT